MNNTVIKSTELLNRYQKIRRIAMKLRRRNSNRTFKSLADLNRGTYDELSRSALFN